MKRNIVHTILSLVLCCLALLAKSAAAKEVNQKEQSPGVQDTDSVLLARLESATLYSILDLQFGRADSLLGIASEVLPGDPGLPYYRNYRQFLDVLIDGDRKSFDDYMEMSGQRIERLRAGSKSAPVSFIYLSSIHLESSVLCAYHREYLRSAGHYYYAWHYLKQGEQRDAGNPVNYRNRGLITLIGASLPEEYGRLLGVIGIRGEMEEGFGYLREYYAASTGAERLEAFLLLQYAGQTLGSGRIMRTGDIPEPVLNGEPDDPSANLATTLRMYVNALEDLSSGRSRILVERMEDYRQAGGERILPYLDLVLGEAMLNLLDTAAHVPLERFVENYQGQHYRHYAWHKISWCYLLQGQEELYEQARQQVFQCGEPYLDADRQALSEALDTLPVNIALLKSRLLFDGGDYRGALEVLGDSDGTSPVPLLNGRDSMEYTYRLARIFDRMDQTDQAILQYKKTIASYPGTEEYFTPNAALHLGMIYESSGEVEMAMEHYRECIKINRSPYKKSIDYKARQGIRRIQNLQKLR